MTKQEWLNWGKELGAQRRAALKETTVTIELTGEEVMQLIHARMLNQRMLDRSPEHGVLDRALTLVTRKLGLAFEATAPGMRCKLNEAELMRVFKELWPED